jgi:hypothetical protein
MVNPKSRAQAINAKCRECIYDPYSAGTWREQTSACASSNCALHAFRPLSRTAKTPEALAALRKSLDVRNRGASA